jgi:hypothetical protein
MMKAMVKLYIHLDSLLTLSVLLILYLQLLLDQDGSVDSSKLLD